MTESFPGDIAKITTAIEEVAKTGKPVSMKDSHFIVPLIQVEAEKIAASHKVICFVGYTLLGGEYDFEWLEFYPALG